MLEKALIAGASGGIGQNLVRYLSTLTDWEIVGFPEESLLLKAKLSSFL